LYEVPHREGYVETRVTNVSHVFHLLNNEAKHKAQYVTIEKIRSELINMFRLMTDRQTVIINNEDERTFMIDYDYYS
jgi:hypothetical protein